MINTDKVDLLNGNEHAVMKDLASAWNAFTFLEELHPDATADFRQAIHRAQWLVMSRPVQRQFNAQRDKADEYDHEN